MMRIHVVHIVEDLKIGGLEQVIAALTVGMDESRFRTEVWCLSRGGEIYEQLRLAGRPVRILGMPAKPDITFIFRLARRLREERVDIVHCHGYTGTTVGRVAAVLAQTPVKVAHVHSTYIDFTPKQLFIERGLSWVCDRVICCSRAVADFVRRAEHISERKIRVIYNGVDVSRFAVPRDRTEYAPVVVGCVASLVPHKGHRFLLEAAAQVIRQMGRRVRFRLAGEGPMRSYLAQRCYALGISAAVEFLGCIQNVPRFLAECDVAVLPSSEREGLGIALLEAMAAGLPVIGTRLGGIPEVITDGRNGLLVPPANINELSRAILALAEDCTLRQRMGAEGKSLVAQKFSQDATCRATEQVYEEFYDRENIRR